MDAYSGPFGRYGSEEMSYLFSSRNRFSTWRRLWLWLAESEQELGINIPDEAIEQMKAHLIIQNDEFETARIEEMRRRHDVMAHVHTFGVAAPAAAAILHLGATSCYVTDNADLIFMKEGLDLLKSKLANVIQKVADFAQKYKDLPTLGFTHGQPAQLVTVGKRASVYCDDLLLDLDNFEIARDRLVRKFRGVKGTTGTQASFLQLFQGDHDKVEALDAKVTRRAGFVSANIITTQTYSRKLDIEIVKELSSFGATCERIGGDLRRLAALKEVEEPFEKDQIGSSAMAYKRNPMRCERLCSLGRKLQHLILDATATYAAQWFERSLDDSGIRRITIPEAFLAADACCAILNNVFDGLVVYPAVIQRRIQEELPFMATENFIMAMSSHGVSRQDAHEEIRILSQQASEQVKLYGRPNDFLSRLEKSDFFKPITANGELGKLLDPSTFIGRAPQQVEKFLAVVNQRLEPYRAAGSIKSGAAELKV